MKRCVLAGIADLPDCQWSQCRSTSGRATERRVARVTRDTCLKQDAQLNMHHDYAKREGCHGEMCANQAWNDPIALEATRKRWVSLP